MLVLNQVAKQLQNSIDATFKSHSWRFFFYFYFSVTTIKGLFFTSWRHFSCCWALYLQLSTTSYFISSSTSSFHLPRRLCLYIFPLNYLHRWASYRQAKTPLPMMGYFMNRKLYKKQEIKIDYVQGMQCTLKTPFKI